MPLFNPESLHSLLDLQIKEHESILLTLKRKRNSLSYISQLPDEILSQIFVFRRDDSLQSLSVPSSSSSSSSSDPFKGAGWVAISCVCQHWRQVSLAVPYLWSYIDFNHAGLHGIKILLERSKLYPLYIKAHVVQYQPDLWKLFADVIAAKTLRRLEFSTDSPTPEVAKLLARRESSAPFLQFLSLVHAIEYMSIEHGKESAAYLWDDMPILGALSIRNFQPPLKFPPLPHLTMLTMHTGDGRHGLTVMRTLEILQQTPRVEVVSLGQLRYGAPSTTSIHYPHVRCPHLKSLELRCSATAQSKVFDYLSLPRTACISLWFKYEVTDTASDDLSPVHRLWGYLADTEPLGKCHINPTEFTTISDDEVYTRINLLDPSSPQKPRLTVNIKGTDYTGSLPSLITRTSALTLGEVMNWWPSLIPYAKNVEILTVKDPSALSRLTLLHPPKEATTELPFPKLKTLVLCDQRLGHTSYGYQPQEQILEYRKLSALLQSRHIETIHIVGGAVSGGVYEHFAKRQLNVVWVNVEFLPNNGPETDDEGED